MFLKFMEKAYFWMVILCLAFIGIAGSNILHFSIEDYYQINMIKSYFFGYEYAYSQSVVLVFSVFFLILLFLKRYLKDKVDLYNLTYKKILIFLIFCFLINIIFYITVVVYSFFSGKSEEGGLYRILVILFLSCMGMYFIYNRVSDKNTLFLKFSSLIETFLLILLNVATLSLTLHFASPKEMANLEKDLESLRMLKNFASASEVYFSQKNQVSNDPKTLQDLGYLKKFTIDLDRIIYKKESDDRFSVCSNFLTNSKDFRRIQRIDSAIPFKKGKFCFTHQLKKAKSQNGGNTVNVLVSSGYSSEYSDH